MRNVHRRDVTLGWQHLHAAACYLRRIREKFKNHDRASFQLRLPTPRNFLPFIIGGSLKTHPLQVLHKRMVGVCICEDRLIDDDVNVAGSRMGGHVWGSLASQVTRRESADEIDRSLVRSKSTQQRDEDPFTPVRDVGAVAVHGFWFEHQTPNLSRRKCSANSLARPEPR